jgi:hypothetical protein
MKIVIGFMLIFSFLNCATYAQENLTYIRSDRLNTSSINIVNVDEFFQLINEYGIKTVFFTDSQFIIQNSSFVYTIDRKGYNNLADYRNGSINFNDGESFYLGQEVGLKNQQEVEYYRGEAFITPSDYRDAVRLGFFSVHSETERNLRGLISREDLQRNIRFANIAVYLRYYYNWNDNRTSSSTGRSGELLENNDIDYLVNQAQGAIRKMNNYEYFVINLQILANKDSFLYYAVRMAQYSNYSEYMANTGPYSIKGTDTILERLGYNNINDMIQADSNGINNSVDYYLTVSYRIDKNVLENNRPLIMETEAVKRRFDLTSNQEAMVLNYILKQPRGMPYSIDILINMYNREYSNNQVAYVQGSPNTGTINRIFSNATQINRLILYNQSGGALYIK